MLIKNAHSYLHLISLLSKFHITLVQKILYKITKSVNIIQIQRFF